jgi:hypothetical protein
MVNKSQNPDLLSMVGLGTRGGKSRADGSALEPGIHLRWQLGEAVGFPPGGFHLYRRKQNLDLFAKCGTLRQRDDGGVVWVCNTPVRTNLVEVIPSGESEGVRGCGQRTTGSVIFPGHQTVRLVFRGLVRHVRIVFDRHTSPTPTGTAFWSTTDGPVVVDREAAQRQPTGEWILRLFADDIDEVVLDGNGMIICEVCFLLVKDGYNVGWDPMPINPPVPIYLPITHSQWNSPHIHSPDDQAEAEARLPNGLSAEKFTAYANGFADDLHQVIYDLVGTNPQSFNRISDTDDTSGVFLNWPGLQLLKLTALDPNLARILGLYWLDHPPDDSYYDYKLVGHYGDELTPGRRYGYSQLLIGSRSGTLLDLEGIRYVSPNPIDVIQKEWDGSPMNALFITRTLPSAPLSISLPQRSAMVTIYIAAEGNGVARGYLRSKATLVVKDHFAAGENTIVLADPDGIETIVIETDQELTIVEIVLRDSAEALDDVDYVTFHHRVEHPQPLYVPDLTPATAVSSRTGLDELGFLHENQSSISLHWNLPAAGGAYLRRGAPVLYQVRRADRGTGEHPAAITAGILLNEDAPVIVTENRADAAAPRQPSYYTDRNRPDGWYSYQVRGIDIFGRLGDWSNTETIRALDRLAPPPPKAVTAIYLDAEDPWLSRVDRDWIATNGPGLKLNWEWPGIFCLQAPDVVPANAEFRIYSIENELNTLSGAVNEVTSHRATSELLTNMTWNGAADELVGESIRVGNNFFPVIGNTSGANCSIEVNNLTLPELAPARGPGTIVFTPGRSYWIDYRQTEVWEKRLHVTPAIQIEPISGTVVNVRDYAEHPHGLITRPGATRTVVTDQSLDDEELVLTPGALLCAGMVYEAYGHTKKGSLRIHIVPPVSPTDSAVTIEPENNAVFTYYPGRKYEEFISGFNLDVESGKATAVANVAVSCSDGKTYTPDNPIWNAADRGASGNRAGNEGSLSPACKVMAVKRSLPLAPGNVPVASGPLFAKPANYYGQAKYTLEWEAVSDVAGYAVYRCSGSALFDHDRKQRQNGKDYYASGSVFSDDPEFTGWLHDYDASLAANDLTNDAEAHLDAWRAWADRFYPTLDDVAIQELANRSGNEKALRRVNKEPVEGVTYLDTFDGRGRGFYVFRVRAIDAANNLSVWSESYPPVHIYDISQPATPVITSIVGGENQITIKWAKNLGDQLDGYLLYRTQEKDKAADWRQMDLTKRSETDAWTVAATQPLLEKDFEFTDLTVPPRQQYYFGVAAVRVGEDGTEFKSLLSAVASGQAFDLTPPEPPEWDELTREQMDDKDQIRLKWRSSEKLTCLVKRQEVDGYVFQSNGAWLDVGVFNEFDDAWVYEFIDTEIPVYGAQCVYQLVVKDVNGNQNLSLISGPV